MWRACSISSWFCNKIASLSFVNRTSISRMTGFREMGRHFWKCLRYNWTARTHMKCEPKFAFGKVARLPSILANFRHQIVELNGAVIWSTQIKNHLRWKWVTRSCIKIELCYIVEISLLPLFDTSKFNKIEVRLTVAFVSHNQLLWKLWTM